MSDKGYGGPDLRPTWRSLAHRVAVAGGSLVALISLFHHVPVSVAALRGAIAYVAVLAVSRLGWVALERALSIDRSAARSGDETDS